MAKLFLDFPITCSLIYKEDYYIIGGGGGSAKTGVKNQLIFYYIDRKSSKGALKQIFQTLTDEYCPTHLAVINDNELVVCCFNGVRMYSIISDAADPLSISLIHKNSKIFELKDSYISTFKIDEKTNIGFFGISNGEIICFDLVNFDIERTVKLHASKITELRFHPKNFDLACFCNDGAAYVYRLPWFEKQSTLALNFVDPTLHYIRNAEFFTSASDTFLITTHLNRNQNKFAYSFIVKWKTDPYFPIDVIKVNDVLVSLSVGSSIIAAGTSTGKLVLYKRDNLDFISKSKSIHEAGISSICCSFKNSTFILSTSPGGSVSCDKLNYLSSSYYSNLLVISIIIPLLAFGWLLMDKYLIRLS